MTPYRILIASTVPLSAPWNGADKNLARMIVDFDESNRYIVQTGPDDAWPEPRVRPIRSARVSVMPTTNQKLRAFMYIVGHTAEADIVHIVASLAHPSPWVKQLIRAWVRAVGKPLVHTVPSVGDATVTPRHLPGDVTVVVSEYTRRLLEEKGITEVVRLYPPLAQDLLRPVSPPAQVAAELRLGQRAVLYPAHYGPDSGIHEMIQAFCRLPADLSDSVLVLACRSHAWQDAEQEARQTMAWATEAGILDRVRLIGSYADMPALISACAVTALVPAKPAGKMDLPMVVLESLALGRPAIVTDRPPISEALLGHGGVAVRFGNVAELTAALSLLLRDAQLRHQLGARGSAAVRAQCDPSHVASQYREIYQRALAMRDGAPLSRSRQAADVS